MYAKISYFLDDEKSLTNFKKPFTEDFFKFLARLHHRPKPFNKTNQ